MIIIIIIVKIIIVNLSGNGREQDIVSACIFGPDLYIM